MPTYKIIKLINLTPLHIGTGKENYDFSATELQSDTLSAALAAIRAQNGNVEDVKGFLESFTISSAFPFLKSSYFLPKMNGKINVLVSGKLENEYRKKLKEIKFIQLDLWSRLIKGETVEVENGQLNDAFLTSGLEDFEKPFKAQVAQRVSVPRENDMDPEPFFFNWTYFNKEAGLYCLIDAEDVVFNEIVSLFKQLGENGIGTDKNIGGGKFEVCHDSDLFIPDVPGANGVMLLSLYIPADEEELGNLHLASSGYELLLRGGYMSGSNEDEFKHLRKRSIYMFSVGSVFSTTKKILGKVVDLAPQWNDRWMHPVLRSGKPFCIPVNYKLI